MPAPSCNVQFYSPGCSQLTNISNKQRVAEIIYLMAFQLNVIGGTNYIGALAGQLYQDAASATIGMDTPKLISAENDIWLSAANNAAITHGVGGALGFQDRMAAIACLLAVPDQDLLRMKTWLLCNLGYHAAYPQ